MGTHEKHLAEHLAMLWGTHEKHLSKVLLMSTHNIARFSLRNKKNTGAFWVKKGALAGVKCVYYDLHQV